MRMIHSIGNTVDGATTRSILNHMSDQKILDEMVVRAMAAAISDQSFASVPPEGTRCSSGGHDEKYVDYPDVAKRLHRHSYEKTEVSVMICQVCGKKEATTHVKTVINGQVSERSLCGECAQKEGVGGRIHSKALAALRIRFLV